jgi:hypothetical protein
MKVVVTTELTFDADDTSARILKDILTGNIEKGEGTMLTENFGVFDYEPAEKVISVEIR